LGQHGERPGLSGGAAICQHPLSLECQLRQRISAQQIQPGRGPAQVSIRLEGQGDHQAVLILVCRVQAGGGQVDQLGRVDDPGIQHPQQQAQHQPGE